SSHGRSVPEAPAAFDPTTTPSPSSWSRTARPQARSSREPGLWAMMTTMGAQTGTADHFVAFVDVLADALDDHDATGADLASRVHLSRFHLDRIVSGAGGRAPGSFRRRVLLERAAFRLLTTDRTVLDLAIEAGY